MHRAQEHVMGEMRVHFGYNRMLLALFLELLDLQSNRLKTQRFTKKACFHSSFQAWNFLLTAHNSGTEDYLSTYPATKGHV